MLAAVLLLPFQEHPALGRDWGVPTWKNKVLLEPGLSYLHPKGGGGAHDLPWPRLELGAWLPRRAPPLPRLTCWFPLLQSFESWMHKWLLFEMAKNPKPEDRKAIPAEKGIRDGGC